MKNQKKQLPEKKVQSLYQYNVQNGGQETTSTCSDPTTTCTTIFTTTHHR